MDVKAYIDGDGTGVSAASIGLTATDNSSIDVETGAAAIAASFGGAAGIAVSIGVGLAKNTISNDVQAYITNADTGITTTSPGAGDIVISATEQASIHSLAMAASVAAGFGGTTGIGVAGAGAEATNVVLTKANAYVGSSRLNSARNVSISSLSTGATLFTLPINLPAADLIAHARMDKKQALSASSDLPGVTSERAGTIAPIDTKLRAAFTAAGNSLAAGDIQVVALDGTSAAEQAWNITSATAWQVIDASHTVYNLSLNAATGRINVSKPVISAQVISAAMGVGGGGAAGVGAAVGVSMARNMIGLGLEQAATVSTVGNNQLSFPLPHGRLTGDSVLYQNDTGTPINGLVPGTTYYCIRVDNTTMKLARTPAEALAGTAITLTVPAASSVAGNSIGFGVEHGFAPGQPVVYSNTNLANAIGGLVSGQTYYVIPSDSSGKTMQLSAAPLDGNGDGIVTLAEKLAALTPIALGTPTSQLGHLFLPVGGLKLIPLNALQVRSYVSDSSITAVGALTQTAVSNATIDASAFAGSVAASLGGAAGVSLGGAGTTISNKIFTRIEASIDGDGATGISAGSVSLTATDASTITSSAGAAAVAAALGGAVGASVAVGVGLSENVIRNLIDARITNADQGVKATTGSITVAAESRSLISATAWAAAVAAAAGGLVGISGAGAGIGAVNSVANTVLAHIDSSKIDILAQNQNLSITATETSSLSALGVAAALAAAVGGGAGVAIGVGGGTATNIVANTVKAYTTGATINTSSSAAATGSGSITIAASANETAKLQLIGAAGSVAIGFAAVAGAAAVAVAENRITDTVSAYASGGTLRTPGSLTIAAQATETLTANAFAAAAAVAAGIGGALAAGGGTATNTLNNSVSADVLGGATVGAGQNVAITAANTATFNASVTAVALAGGLVGGSIGLSTITNTDTSLITAKVSSGSVTSTSGGVLIAASATDTTGTILGIATAVTAGLGGAGAGTDVQTDFSPRLFSTVASGATVAATAGTVSITSTLSSQARAETYGAAFALVAIGTASGYSNANGTVEAIANGTVTAGTIVLNSQATTSAEFSGAGLAGGLVAGAVGRAEATSSPNVKALVGSASTLTATGAVRVYATAQPSATATSLGVAVGLGALGASTATATASPLVFAGIGGNVSSSNSTIVDWSQTQAGRRPVVLTGLGGNLGSLDIQARVAPADGSRMAHSRATAGSGGLIGIAGAAATAVTSGGVTAMIGNNLRLPNGNVGVLASGATSQWAEGLGKANGLVGVGSVTSTATSALTTLAQVASGVVSDQNRLGSFSLQANGNNTNRAATLSSSGGLIAGSCAFAVTEDTSASRAIIGAGARIYGTSLDLVSYQQTSFNPTSDASSASLAGASGATTTNVSSTAASTLVGSDAVIDMLGKVELRAKNYFRPLSGGFNARGGSAGVAAAAAGSADSTLTGVSEVVLGDRVTVHSSGWVANSDQYPIVMAATQGAETNNRSIMNSNGALAGTGVTSSLLVTLTNRVTLGVENVVKTEAGDISIGTGADSSVSSTAETTTNAGLSLAYATTTTTLTANQTVTIGSGSTLFADGNIWLTPGKDIANNEAATTLAASASAQAHTKGLAGIPHASADSQINSNASLTINGAAKIQTGGNVTIGGYPGTLTPVADGTGTGDQLFGLVTTVEKDSRVGKTETSTVTQNGIIEAGIFRTLKIVIPNSQNAGVATQASPANYLFVDNPATTTQETLPASAAGSYSRTLQVNTDNDSNPLNDLPFKPFQVTYHPAYDPIASIDSYTFNDPTVAEVLKSGVTADRVVAMRLEGLTARGGVVAINASSIQGSGSITAYGAPTIAVDNNSPNYLIVSDLTIPNEVFGRVYFTGSAAAAPSLAINTPGGGLDPQITVNNNFSSTVGSEGAFGPALFLVSSTPLIPGTTGTGIVNLSGAVNLINAAGSIAQAGVVFAASFRAYAPNGFYAVSISNPDTTYFAGSNPISDWYSQMVLPGRISADHVTASFPSANLAAEYVANAVYNSNGVMNSSQLSNFLENRPGGPQKLVSYYRHDYNWGFAGWGSGKVEDLEYEDQKNSLIVLGRDPDSVPPIAAYPLTYARNFSAIQGTINSNSGPQIPATPGARSVTDTLQVGISAGKIAISARYVNINNRIESGRAVTVNITTSQADLDGLVSLYNDLTSRGISLPTTTTASRVATVIEQIRGLSGSVASATVKNDLVTRVCRYTYLGYFNGSQTARIPLQTLTDSQRASANTYASGVVATTSLALPVYPSGGAPSFDDRVAVATFGLATRSINIGDVNAVPNGGFVYINGRIINTSTAGLIKSVGGAGQVRIDNPTTYPLTVGNIKTSAPGATTVSTNIVNIVDNNLPNAIGQSVYSYIPGIGVQKYVGPAYTSERVLRNGVPQNDSWGIPLYKVVSYKDIIVNQSYLVSSTQGTETTYAPMAGQRWQWQMQASITRVPTTPITTGPTYQAKFFDRPQVSADWAFVANNALGTSTTQPWAYTGPGGIPQRTPYGSVITGSSIQSDFSQTISGEFSGIVDYVYVRRYHNRNWNDFRREDTYTSYHFKQRFLTVANIRVTASVRADNPFSISFATDAGLVQVNSTGTLTLGQIVSPIGPVAVTLGSTAALVPSTSVDRPFAIEAQGLTITAPGSSIGTVIVPLQLKLVPGTVFSASAGIGGVYVRGTDVVTLGAVSSGVSDSTYGPVSIDASAGIASTGNWLVGRSITLTSANSTIGTLSMPLKVSPRGTVSNADSRTVSAPSLKATASGDIRLQAEGDLWVDSIRSVAGSVVVNAPAGKVLNLTNTTSADALGQALVEQGWARLQLTGTGAQERLDKVVTTYEEQVASRYQAYWQLMRHGSVSQAVYSLNADKLSLYRLRVTLALGKSTDATDAEVQTFARGLYADVLNFFDRNFSTAYWTAKAAGNNQAAEAAVAGSSHAWLVRSEFVGDVGVAFAWTATADQREALTRNGVWSEAALKGAINFSALTGSAVVGTSAAPNIIGRNVTINDSSVVPGASTGVGKVLSAVTITFDQLLGRNSAVLSNDDRAALLAANTPGDIELYGTKTFATVRTAGYAAAGSLSLDVASSANLVVGMPVPYPGYPAGTRIASINGTTVVLTAAAIGQVFDSSIPFGGSVDVLIPFVGGEAIVPEGFTPSKIRLPQNAPLFVNALGTVSVNTVGSIYLQSTASDLKVGTIRSTSSSGVVEITAPGSIGVADGGTGILAAGNLALLAGVGSIGAVAAPLPIAVGGTLLSATAGDRIYLSHRGNLVYGQIYAGTGASIAASGSIEFAPDASGTITSGSVALTAGTTIGQVARVKVVLLPAGSLTVAAAGNVRLAGSADGNIFSAASITSSAGGIDINVTGDAQLGTLTAMQGTATVAASREIFAGQSSTANIVARETILAANGGSIGAFNSDGSPNRFLRLSVSGTTTASAFGRIALQQDVGNLNVAGINADGDVSLTAAAGSILNAPGVLGNVITARNLILAAAGAIGLPGQDLVVDLAAGYALSATAAAGIQLTESSGDLRVARVTTTSGGVRLTVPTGSFALPADAVLQATSGPVLLQVRNDVSLAATSTAAAATWFAIVGSYGRTGGPASVLSTSRTNNTSVINSPYTSIGSWAGASQGAATAAGAGYADSGKTTLATFGKAPGDLAGPIASDSRGNVTFFDPATQSLKQLDWTGTIRTLTSSGIVAATALAVDSSGNVFIADRGGVSSGPGSIKVWNAATGSVTKLLDTATSPTGVAVDSAGNLFYSDGSDVKRRAALTGTVSTIFSGSAPRGFALDAAGNLYVADAGANLVRKWTASGGVVSTLTTFTGLNAPQGIAVDADGDVTVADTGNNRIVKLDTATGLVSTLISGGLSSPTGVAIDPLGNLYTVNTGSSSSTLDVFQPWADVPATPVGHLAAAGSDTLSAVIPTTQGLYGAFVPTSDQPWLRATGVVDGRVQFAFDAAPGGLARTGNLTILGRQVTISQAAGLSQMAVTSAAAIAYGSTGSVTLRVTSTYATPTGTVGLAVDGGNTLFGTLVAGSSATVNDVTTYSATVTILVAGLSLALGDHALVATYESQATFLGSTALGTIRVNRAASAASLSSSNTLPTYGDQVTLTASVPRAGSGAYATGTITIKDGSQTLASGPLVDGSFTYAVSSLSGGTHNLTAEYAGDANYLGSTSAPVVATVQQKSAVPTLVLPALSPAYGSVVRLTATVPTAVPGTPVTGTIRFYDGQTLLGTGTPSVVDGALTATLDTATIAGGWRSIRAEYSGDGTSYAATVSASTAFSVQLGSAVPVVASGTNPSAYGDNASYIATLAAVGGGAKPTGTVQFSLVAAVTGTAASGAREVTVASAAGLAPGMVVSGTVTVFDGYTPRIVTTRVLVGYNWFTPIYSYVATCVWDPIYAVVNAFSPNTTVAAISGTSVTLSTGTLAALNGSVINGTMPVGPAQTIVDGQATVSTALLSAPLAVGTYSITSSYSGDGNYAASSSTAVTQTVSKATSVPAVVGDQGSTTTFGNSVTFTATVPRAGTGAIPTGTVQFLDNGVPLGAPQTINPATGTAALVTSALTVGRHSITASYGGDANYSAASVSPSFSQTVTKLASSPGLSTSAATSVHGQSVTLSARIGTVGTGGVPSGTITFWNFTNASSPVAISPAIPVDGTGTANFITTTLPTGSLQLRAIYSGNANYESTTSNTLSQTVGKVAAAATLVSSSAAVSYGSAVTITATVKPAVNGSNVQTGSNPTGTVQFLDGSTPITAAVTYGVVNGALTAAITTTTLPAGTRTITAVYSGDANYLAPTSSPVVSQTVNRVASTATLSGSPNPSSYGSMVQFTARVPAIPGVAAPTGTIAFFANASTTPLAGSITYGVYNGVYTATLATAALPAGPHTVRAQYAGDANYASTTSSNLSHQVNAIWLATSLASSASGTTPTVGTPVTLTARVTGATTGTVEFRDYDTPLPGTIAYSTSNGVLIATLTTSALSGGSRLVNAMFSTTNYVGKATIQQNIAHATVTPVITAKIGTAVAATATSGTMVDFVVTLDAVNGVYPQGRIQFKDRGTLIQAPVPLVLDSVTGKMTATLRTQPAIGSHGFTGTFTATDAKFVSGTTSSESLFTTTPPTTATIPSSVAIVSTVTSARAGATVSLAASGPADGAVIEFWDGNKYLGKGAIASGRAVFAVNTLVAPLSVGTHRIQARFVGTTTVRASVSADFLLTIT